MTAAQTERPPTIVVTDLDGTLLDLHTRSWAPAEPALRELQERGVPVVLCSAKTRAEILPLREALGIEDPFIVENGGAVYVPKGYFPFAFPHDREFEGFSVLELGLPYAEIRRRIERVRRELGVAFRGFGDLTAEEVAEITGLSLEEARRAKAREYDETLLLGDLSAGERERVLQALERAGLRWTHGGVFHHALGAGTDKGRAVRKLLELYRREHGEVFSVGLGDGRNDEPLLRAVDLPLLVQKPDGTWEDLDLPGLVRVEGVGPEGWRRAVEAWLRGELPHRLPYVKKTRRQS